MSWIIITGATDGLGLALARLYAPHARLLLLGRRPRHSLTDPLFDTAVYCEADLSDPDQAAHKLVACIHEHAITDIAVVIHNAATGYYGRVEQQSAAKIAEVLTVNLRAPLVLTQRLLPFLDNAKVVLISSIASTLPAAEYAVYAASKAALEAWGRALRAELAPHIQLQILRLGATRTGMHAKLGIDQTVLDWTRFAPVDTVAQHVKAAIDSSAQDRVIGWSNRLVWAAGYWAGGLLERIARWRSRGV